MIKVCIGYDPAETVAYHVLCHSILSRCSQPVQFIPINKRNIPEFRRDKQDGSTEFSFSRFLTPYLAGYNGQAIFMDCDMLVRCDISKVLEECDLRHDVFVVKHDYTPKTEDKFLGNKQHVYPKKNWSSFMVFNCFNQPCKRLTPSAVSANSGAWLHQFEWTQEERIGELGKEWNHLVGEYDENPDAKVVHYTLGTPCFEGYDSQEFSDEWYKELRSMNYAAGLSDRMYPYSDEVDA
jgi:lipopolysaccharide biosynthesis glycosyltransferase